MPKLTETNPYLRDPALRAEMVRKSVASSSAIEGIRAPFKNVDGHAKSSPKSRDGKSKSHITKK